MEYVEVFPEVATELGDSQSSNLSVIFMGWMGCELMEMTPYFMVTRRIAEALEGTDLTGFTIRECAVSYSPEYEYGVITPYIDKPIVKQLDVTGTYLAEDFSISPERNLVVSHKALAFLFKYNMFGLRFGNETSDEKDNDRS